MTTLHTITTRTTAARGAFKRMRLRRMRAFKHTLRTKRLLGSPSELRSPIEAVSRGEAGFTLPELLVVLVIVGILAVLAIPRFFNVTARAKMAEAKLMLRQVYTLQEAHYYEYDRYAADLAGLGFEQARLVSEEGTARYVLTIEEADGAGFMAIATSVVDFDKDGTFNVWEVDAEGVIRQRVAD